MASTSNSSGSSSSLSTISGARPNWARAATRSRVSTITRRCCASSAAVSRRPMKPVAPVTSTVPSAVAVEIGAPSWARLTTAIQSRTDQAPTPSAASVRIQEMAPWLVATRALGSAAQPIRVGASSARTAP